MTTLEPNLGSDEPSAPLAASAGSSTGASAIFWNGKEMRSGWRLLIFLMIALVIATIEMLAIEALHIPQMKRGTISATVLLLSEGPQVLAVLAAAAIMGGLEGRPFGAYGLPRDVAFGAMFWQGAAWGLGMITAIILLIDAFHGYSLGDFALHGPLLWGYAALWGVVFLLVGFFEEFLFRGYAQFTLATGIGFWPAALALSALFGLVHRYNSGEDNIGALSVFVIGLFFCLTLRRTGSLWFAVGLHFTFDWGETFLFSVPNSGLVAPGHLLNSSFHGPVWLTGGSVGPEGSVMSFVVVSIAAGLFAVMYRPNPSKNEALKNVPS